MEPFTPATPLRRVNATLRQAIERQDWALLAAAAPGWRSTRSERNAKTLIEFALHQSGGEHALGELIRLGYPVSPEAVYKPLSWIGWMEVLNEDSSMAAWHALRPAIAGRADCIRPVVQALEEISRPSLYKRHPVVPWRELQLEGLFSPTQWQAPLKHIYGVYSATNKSRRSLLSLTPLQYAWAMGRPALCEALIRAGAPVAEPEFSSSWRGWSFQHVVVDRCATLVAGKAARTQVQELLDNDLETGSRYTRDRATWPEWERLFLKLPVILRERTLNERLPQAHSVAQRERF